MADVGAPAGLVMQESGHCMIILACVALATWLVCWYPSANRRQMSIMAVYARRKPCAKAKGRRWVWPVCALLVILFIGIAAPRVLIWLVPVSAAIGTFSWLVNDSRQEAQRQANSEEALQVCLALAAQLRAGDVLSNALTTVAQQSSLV